MNGDSRAIDAQYLKHLPEHRQFWQRLSIFLSMISIIAYCDINHKKLEATKFPPGAPAEISAYLYHLAMNHPFVDGNKRTAFAVMIVFVELNGYRLDLFQEQAYSLVIRVVQGEMTKQELSAFLQKHIQQR